MDGRLCRYGPKPQHVAFLSSIHAGTTPARKAIVAVGGLSCGLLFAEYISHLDAKLADTDICLVQPLLSSSHTSWGISSVSEDALEIDRLLEFFWTTYGISDFVLLGHSTGCQDAVMYVRRYGQSNFDNRNFRVRGVILQGPVSDREFLADFLPDVKEKIELCRKLLAEGRGDDIALMFRWEDGGEGTPVTARRFLSLADVGGEDDMFSSHGVDLGETLGSLRGMPTLVLMSGADECQVGYIDPGKAGVQLKDAIGDSASLVVIERGLHDLKGKETSEKAARVIVQFAVQTLT